MTVDLPRAMTLAAELDRILPGIPGRYEDRAGHEAGVAALCKSVWSAEPRGILKEVPLGGEIRAFGIRCTSTMGVIGACRNFVRRVEHLAGVPLRQAAPVAGD